MEIAGLKMRPFTVRCRLNCLALGLTLFTDPEICTIPECACEKKHLSAVEIEEQMAALVWERTQPLTVVRSAIDNKRAQESIDEFTDSLPPSALPLLVAEINRVAADIRAQAVEVVPRSETVDDKAPGN